MMKLRNTLYALFLVTITLTHSNLFAQAPKLINYQGNLVENGEPVNGIRDLTFTIYDAPSGGTILFQETHENVQISDGVFSVLLGSKQNMANDIFSGTDRYLGVKVGGQAELSPRFQFTSVAYSLSAESVSGGTPTSNIFPSDGNVGIGTTTPGAKLDVSNIIRSTESNLPGFEIHDGTALQWQILNHGVNGGGTNRLGFWEDGVDERMVILEGGNVGIGTESPQDRLHINGTIQASGQVGLRLTHSNGQIRFHGESGNEKWAIGSDGSPGDDFLIAEVPSSAVRLLIDESTGNVGIGTTNPQDRLHVSGTIQSSGQVGLRLTHSNAQIRFHGESGNEKWAIGSTGAPGDDFLISDISSQNVRMLIDESTGNVGIGTTDPKAKLHVEGNVQATGYKQGSDGETLRTIRGRVRTDGTIQSGAGFIAANDGTGSVRIDFTTPYASIPTATASAFSGSPIVAVLEELEISYIKITMFDLAGLEADGADISFIVVGTTE